MSMIYLLCALTFIMQDTCRQNYLNAILNSRTEDYFIVVKALKDQKKVDLLLTKRALIDNLGSSNITNEDLVLKIIQDEIILEVNDSTKYFTVLKRNKYVSRQKKKGKEYFLKKYFNELGYLKKIGNADIPNEIAGVLISWNILVLPMESTVFISKKRFCVEK